MLMCWHKPFSVISFLQVLLILSSHLATASGKTSEVSVQLRHRRHHRKHHHRHHRNHPGTQNVSGGSVQTTILPTGLVQAGIISTTDSQALSAPTLTTTVSQALSDPTPTASAAELQFFVKETNQSKSTATLHSHDSMLAEVSTTVEPLYQGVLKVNAPLPADFAEAFQKAAAFATGCNPSQVVLRRVDPVDSDSDVLNIIFQGPAKVLRALVDQAGDPDSPLANGPLRSFLVDRSASDTPSSAAVARPTAPTPAPSNIDTDASMPFVELEAFGRESTAEELTEASLRESDAMVDQIERAEVAEEKRSIFRALTRLRGAALAAFDGIARSQTSQIDSYTKSHKWSHEHKMRLLATEESDVSKWAFPEAAD